MINKADIKKAIAECQGEPNPNSTTCIKLAAYYTILNNLEGENMMSFASRPVETAINTSDSEFFEAIEGLKMNDVLAVMDELMDGVRTMIPRLYNATIERLKNL